jgi:hypothetical protein
MGGLSALLSVALAATAVGVDQAPLREGCDSAEPVVAYLAKGDPLDLRFAVAGAAGGCYKVVARTDGRTIQGYLRADAIEGIEEFDRERRAAPAAGAPAVLKADGGAIQQAMLARDPADPGARAARLIEAGRPAEALELLQPVLRANGQDPGLLSLAGYAAYRADDARSAAGYWQRSLALRPSPAVQRLLEKAEKELREDKSGERLVGTRFLLRYSRSQMEPAVARTVVAMLEQEFSRVSLELGCAVDERIVAIVQTPDEYRATTDAAAWSAGQYNGRIRVAAVDQQGLDAAMRRTLAHEMVHACLAGLGDFPVWLHEGLAQKLSGEVLSEGQRAQVRQLARAGQLPRLGRLNQTWSRMSAEHASLAYATALEAANLFYQHHAGLGVRNLLRNPHLFPQIEADLDRRLRE